MCGMSIEEALEGIRLSFSRMKTSAPVALARKSVFFAQARSRASLSRILVANAQISEAFHV
jgi:hypothetical protein